LDWIISSPAIRKTWPIWLEIDHFSFIRHDVANFIFVPGEIDYVLHFASPASPNPASPLGYPNLPIQTLKAGALGTHNSLGVARAYNAKFLAGIDQ
jgi:dTDP-glucose 4,6-dehydratase